MTYQIGNRIAFRAFFGGVLLSVLVGTVAFSGTPFFNTLSIKDGLPSNIIAAVAQDKHNFIWVATGNGLSRYDGYRFKTFKKSDSPNSIPSNQISCLLADGDFLWVGTWAAGLCKINTSTFEITRIELRDHNVIRTLYKKDQRTLWIGTETGLIQYVDNNVVKIYNTQNSGLSHNTIRSIFQDSNENLWVGTYDKLNKLPKGSNAFVTIDLKGNYKTVIKNNLISGNIKPFSENSDSLLWVGTETGICLFNTITGSYQRFSEKNVPLSNEVVKCIYTDDNGNLWLGTDFGLNIFNPRDHSNTAYFHNPTLSYSIANNVIWQIFEDKGGVIWLATSNGLSRLNKHGDLYTYHEVSYPLGDQTIGNQVKSVLVTKNGVTWLGTSHGVIRVDPVKNKKEIFDTNSPPHKRILLNNVFALEEDDFGRIWIGTAQGINIWDEQEARMYAITTNATNGLVTNYIAKFVKGTDGSFWVSAWEGGLFKVQGNLRNPHALHFQLTGNNYGSERTVSGEGAIWIIQYDELFRVDLKTYKRTYIQSFNQLASKKDIHCLYFSEKGTLWAGTQNGLIEYDPKTDAAVFHPLITGNDVQLGNIIEDNDGNIWCATTNTITKLSIPGHKAEMFPLDRDLPLKSFFYGCSARTSSGEILFGGDNGYISLQPGKVLPNTYQPNVYITGLEINNKPIASDEKVDEKVLLENDISFMRELTLDYAHRSIAFEFSALHYWQPSLNVYAYKLDGFDDDWKYVSGQKNFAVYSNLSPGSYTLHVKGTNNYGIWSDRMATLSIYIKPPLFLSQGFIILYILLAIGITVIALRTYSARLHLKNELRIAHIEKEHAEEISKTKQQFFTNISHELRTPISLILPPIHQILKRGNLDEENLRLISLAEKNSHRLLRVVNQILDFRKLESGTLQLKVTSVNLAGFCHDLYELFTDKAARKEIDFSFSTNTDDMKVWVDVEKIETVLFNLVSNAFKFTPKGGTINLSTTSLSGSDKYPEGAAGIAVSDSGIGIDAEDIDKIFEPFFQTRDAKKMEIGTGIGLALAAEYVKLHHGEISVDSTKGKGTSFTILLPLGNSHFPIDSIHDNDEISLLATRSIHPLVNGNGSMPYRFDLESNKPLVLVIDDSRDMIDFVRVSLKEKYNFVIAENGEEGLQKANNFLPEVIISDIMMPVMDGLTLCKKIKESPKTSHISIILLTAKGLTSQKIEGIRMGADAYITKPFEIELLEANIDHLLARKKELADYFRNELITQPSSESTKENVDDKFIRKVMSIIDANISNPDFSVEMLSDEIGMSSTHLYRKLKSLTKLSANEIIKKYRIKKASLLLKNKEGNISEIMYDVGFSNLSYFSKCFKAEFGVTPKEYQQKTGSHTIDIDGSMGI